MEEQLVSFNTGELAATKGFKWECDISIVKEDGTHDKFPLPYSLAKRSKFKKVPRPTLSLLQKWFRTLQNISVEIYANASGWCWVICKTDGTFIDDYNYIGPNDSGCWDSYEDALEAALVKALELIK